MNIPDPDSPLVFAEVQPYQREGKVTTTPSFLKKVGGGYLHLLRNFVFMGTVTDDFFSSFQPCILGIIIPSVDRRKENIYSTCSLSRHQQVVELGLSPSSAGLQESPGCLSFETIWFKGTLPWKEACLTRESKPELQPCHLQLQLCHLLAV